MNEIQAKLLKLKPRLVRQVETADGEILEFVWYGWPPPERQIGRKIRRHYPIWDPN